MNLEQLNTIKERLAKATPGPWESEETTEGHIDIFNPDEDYTVCQTGNETYDCLNAGDTEFIKHAITDVPVLVAEVERLSEELTQSNVKRMKLVVDKAYEKSKKHEYIKTIHLVNEENRRLREALEHVQSQLFSIRGVNNIHDSEITGLCVEIREALDGESDVQRKQDHHT